MKKIKDRWFIVAFAITMLFPLYGSFLEKNIVLSGVTAAPTVVEATNESLKDGTYQTYLNDVWENNFSGKKFLLKIRNQLLYSFWKVSPNSNVVIGKNDYLYEPEYILQEIQIHAPATEDYFENLENNLIALDLLLQENGKELYVFVTPSKAHFYEEYIPNSYMRLNNIEEYDYTNYEKLIETLENSGVSYYDSINYIEENLYVGKIQSPLFYKSGIHWSHVWGESAAAEFLAYMKERSKFDLTTVEVTEYLSDVPIEPDTDLYSSLNVLLPADEQWYRSQMNVVEVGQDHPTVFLRGGSFMGQSLNALIKCGVFGEDVHFENSYYHMNQYTASQTISGFNAYEEIPLDILVGKSDVLILEVNEAKISNMSWGFIEYLLEHPEYLDYNY